uniref:Histone deacetylase 11 n=1 Tax=Steinernema glaseri TaxID=37863 RepID=A0A1I8AGB6_9BILA
MSTSHGEQSQLHTKLEARKQRVAKTDLFVGIRANQWPIVYHPDYNISFFGLEKLHPFDSKKWGNVFRILVEAGMLKEETITTPHEATRDDLLVIHTPAYLNSLECPCSVAHMLEVPAVAFIPKCLLNSHILHPMRLQTGGTVAAARLALDRNWAINIGGGFHHARSDKGEGFCLYADISIALEMLLTEGLIKTAMIVDLDAHQGNGHEHDFGGDQRIYIFDMFNYEIFPRDNAVKTNMSRSVRLQSYTGGTEYLRKLKQELHTALGEFTPDLMLYNAGTDCLSEDPLGCLSLSPKAVIQRDEIVFEMARDSFVPIVMVTSGGYLPSSAQVIADSILNLHAKKLIKLTN